MSRHRTYLRDDWYPGGIPANVQFGAHVYIDSAYSFSGFRSRLVSGLVMGEASGAYDRTSFIVGESGYIEVGAYSCLNSCTLVCHERITIGSHCFISWGVVVADNVCHPRMGVTRRREALARSAASNDRVYPQFDAARPVVIEDNVWIGFDAVILPGVRLGKGCIVGCKTVIRESVPAYHVVAGEPPRLIRRLTAVDTPAVRERALQEATRG